MNMDVIRQEINSWFRDYFEKNGTYNKLIYEAMEYSIEVGGKRIRPILMILTYNMYNNDYKKILPISCALEMIHTYSLIHDDLPAMDNDDLRRGKPTNHKVFGEAIAILAGDGLLNEAFNIMFEYCTNNPGKNVIEGCKLISNASGVEGMIGGQVVDIISEGKNISKEQLNYMHSKKTGELIKAAVLCGAILGEAEEEEIHKLARYSEKLGVAFQIKDDILDVVGDEKVLGKNTNSDSEKEKTNFISQYGLEECKKKCETLTNECLVILDNIGRDTRYLKELTLFLLNRDF